MTATLPELEHTVFPPEDRAPLSRVATFVEAHREQAALVGPDGALVDLPSEVYRVLIDVVEAMHAGRAITVAPQSTWLTTMEAANLLGISRPTLVKLLETGAIAFEQPGRHRRVRLADVLAYRDRRRDERRQILGELTADAVDAGMYDTPAADYAEALREARRRPAAG